MDGNYKNDSNALSIQLQVKAMELDSFHVSVTVSVSECLSETNLMWNQNCNKSHIYRSFHCKSKTSFIINLGSQEQTNKQKNHIQQKVLKTIHPQ